MTDICASCKSTNISKITKLSKDILPKWLEKKNYVDEFIKDTDIRVCRQKDYDIKQTIKIGASHKNRFVLYFASTSSSDLLPIKGAKKAYGNFSNHGVSKVNSRGECQIYLTTPQPYKTIKKNERHEKTFYRHMHFVISDKQNQEWEIDTIYTKVLHTSISLNDLLHNHLKHKVLLLNTLPCEYYAKSHIPNSYNLPVKQIKKMSSSELNQWIKEVLKLNNHHLYQLLQKKQIDMHNIPIAVYCAHKKCNASEMALLELSKKQFVNVVMYEEGMAGYIKHVNSL